MCSMKDEDAFLIQTCSSFLITLQGLKSQTTKGGGLANFFKVPDIKIREMYQHTSLEAELPN